MERPPRALALHSFTANKIHNNKAKFAISRKLVFSIIHCHNIVALKLKLNSTTVDLTFKDTYAVAVILYMYTPNNVAKLLRKILMYAFIVTLK